MKNVRYGQNESEWGNPGKREHPWSSLDLGITAYYASLLAIEHQVFSLTRDQDTTFRPDSHLDSLEDATDFLNLNTIKSI